MEGKNKKIGRNRNYIMGDRGLNYLLVAEKL
jgi:hypothetical protein